MSRRHRNSRLQGLLPILLIGAVVCSCLCVTVVLIATGGLKLSSDDNQPTVVAEQTYSGSSAKSVGTEPEATKVKSVGSDSTVAVATPSPVMTVEKQPSAIPQQLGGKVFPTSTSASPATQEPTLKPFFNCRLLAKQNYPAPEDFAIVQDLDGTVTHDVVDTVTCQLTKITATGTAARVIGWFGTAEATAPEWLKIQVVERVILISRRYVDRKWWAQYIPSRTPWPTLTPTVASGGQVAAAGGKVFPTVATPTPSSQKASVFGTAPVNDCKSFRQINRVYPLTLDLSREIGSRDNPDVIDAGTCGLAFLPAGTYVVKGWYGSSTSEAWLMVQDGTKYFYVHPRFVPVTTAQQPVPKNTPIPVPPTATTVPPTATAVPPTSTPTVQNQSGGYTFRQLPGCPETLRYSGQAVKMSTNQPTSLAQGSYKVGGWWVIQDGKYIGVRAEYQGEHYLILRGSLSPDISGCAS